MVWRVMLLVPVALCTTVPAQAGVIFNRSSKHPFKQPATVAPTDPVGDLIHALRTEADERRRAAIANELSRFDLKQAPQAGGALIEALQSDPSPLVRNEVAEALGRMRPLTQQVGQALEQAFSSDPASRVRLTARASLVPFIQAGYKPANRSEFAGTEMPRVAPAAPPRPAPAAPLGSPLMTRNARQLPARETVEPPLAGVSPTDAAKAKAATSVPPTAPPPSIMRVNPPKTIAEPRTTGPTIKPDATSPARTTVAKPAPAKPAPAPVKPAPAPVKPEVEGPILIPPE
jgi:HEAT repeats